MKYPEELKAKLTPEQLFIVEKWEKESAERLELLDIMQATKTSDEAAYQEAYSKYKNLISNKQFCEHGRSIWSNCAACQEIEDIVCPQEVSDTEKD